MTRRALPLLVLLLAAACGSGGTPKDLGCITDLGSAESAFNDAEKGVSDSTATNADFAASMKTVKDKLADLNVVNPEADIKAKADEGSQAAGRLRVAISNGSSVDPADVNVLRAAINTLDAACVKAGK